MSQFHVDLFNSQSAQNDLAYLCQGGLTIFDMDITYIIK